MVKFRVMDVDTLFDMTKILIDVLHHNSGVLTSVFVVLLLIFFLLVLIFYSHLGFTFYAIGKFRKEDVSIDTLLGMTKILFDVLYDYAYVLISAFALLSLIFYGYYYFHAVRVSY